MAKKNQLFHTRKYTPISLVNIVIAKRDNMYTTQAMLSNAVLHSGGNVFNDTMNNEVTVSYNSEGAMLKTAGHGSTITLLNEGLSTVNNIFGNKIIRNEK